MMLSESMCKRISTWIISEGNKSIGYRLGKKSPLLIESKYLNLHWYISLNDYSKMHMVLENVED